jgi:dephospho-CoA kinase
MTKNKILNIGITGGIGSGKTTVCKIFETLGIPIYYADDRAKAHN